MRFLRFFLISFVTLIGCFVLFISFASKQTPDEFLASAGQQIFTDNAPIQTHLDQPKARSHKKYNMMFHYSFELGAKVLSAKHYSMDRESKLSPVDLALGWGRMAEDHVIERIDISQSGRFYRWYAKRYPIPRQEIINSSANMHMIPADKSIEKALKSVEQGDKVYIKGYLARITGAKGWYWNSSTTRSDTGHGACEIIYVEDIRVQKR